MSKMSVGITVEGKVQGVWFRASAKSEADRLGLTGSVKNLPEGSVFIEVCGKPDQIGMFISWCLQGPEHANVTGLRVDKRDAFERDEFEIIR